LKCAIGISGHAEEKQGYQRDLSIWSFKGDRLMPGAWDRPCAKGDIPQGQTSGLKGTDLIDKGLGKYINIL